MRKEKVSMKAKDRKIKRVDIHIDTKQNDIQHNDTKHDGLDHNTEHK